MAWQIVPSKASVEMKDVLNMKQIIIKTLRANQGCGTWSGLRKVSALIKGNEVQDVANEA